LLPRAIGENQVPRATMLSPWWRAGYRSSEAGVSAKQVQRVGSFLCHYQTNGISRHGYALQQGRCYPDESLLAIAKKVAARQGIERKLAAPVVTEMRRA